MANTRAKEVSESYKGSEITFDKTTSGAVDKAFVATDVQTAIVEAKPKTANMTTVGIARQATDAESNNGTTVNAYVAPNQVAAKINTFWLNTIKPEIPAATELPTFTYGGKGKFVDMQATYSSLPIGSFVVFEEYYTYLKGWGNGSSWVSAYRRRTMVRTNNAGWMMVFK